MTLLNTGTALWSIFASDKTWTVWDETTTLSAVDDDGEYVLYLRGTGNTKIGYYDADDTQDYIPWAINGTDVRCDGNSEQPCQNAWSSSLKEVFI